MKNITYPLAESTWNNDEVLAGISVLMSGKCTMGEKVKQFEEAFAKMFGSKYAVMSNSGSSANLLMLSALKYSKKYNFQEGDEIIVPAVSWSTTYYPVYQNGFKLKFVDIDKDTLNIDVKQIIKNITPKTKAILAVNILGNPCDFEELITICRNYNIMLLEDNCESMYAQHGGKFCGTIGKMGTYSSFFSHHICTIEGGITTTDDEELYQIMLSLRAHGWTRDLPNDNHVHNKTGIKSDDMFRFVLPGYNLRPNEIYAAIGLEQLKKLPTFINYRVHNYAYFKTKYAEFSAQYGDIFTLQKYNNGYYSLPSYFAITMTLKGKMDGKKTEFMEYLLSNNIECRPVVAGNFTKNPVIKHMPHEICGDMTNAENVDKNGLFIGNHSYDIKDKIDYFFEKLKDYVNRI